MKLLARAGKLLMRLGRFVTDSCRSVCCGCPVARKYTACAPSTCTPAPEQVWICDPSTCQSNETVIKWNGLCYRRTDITLPIGEVPITDVVITAGQYICLPDCDDPLCQDSCGDYLRASLCPGQTTEILPPVYVRADSVTPVGCVCGTFRHSIRNNPNDPLLCYFLDLNGARFRLNQLPIASDILTSVSLNCNKTCCDCIVQCNSPDQVPPEPQFACFGPFTNCDTNGVPSSQPVQVGELRCCCSDTNGGPNQGRFRIDVTGQIRVLSSQAGSVARIELDLSGSYTEPFDPNVQQPRWRGVSIADGTVTPIDDPYLGQPGIPCGRWLWHDLGFGGIFFGFPLHGKCPSETCGITTWSGGTPGERSTIDRSIIQITCYSTYRSGKWTYVNPLNGNQVYTIEYFIRSVRYEQGLCGGGCGSTPPVPGAAQSLKGGPYLATNTGCASCGASADLGSGGATI